MGRGDQFQMPKFTVPLPAAVQAWPFPEQVKQAYCPLCDRPTTFCECPRLCEEQGSED